MRPVQIQSTAKFNSVIWIKSLRATEEGVTRRIQEDVYALLDRYGAVHQDIVVNNLDDMRECFAALAIAVSEGACPILYFDMHGDETGGLEFSPSRERMSWTELYQHLREINCLTECNLIVIAACCFGAHLLSPLDISQTSAVYVLIAPEDKVELGFLEVHVPLFFERLFAKFDLLESANEAFGTQMYIFHCQQALARIIAKYFNESCRGGFAKRRRERVLTDFFAENPERAKSNLPAYRAIIRAGVRPRQETIDTLSARFLGKRQPGFELADLLAEIEG